MSMTARPAWAGLAVALAVLTYSTPLAAWETRSLPTPQPVPLHSSVVVSALPAAGAARDAEPTRVRIQPRRRPDPEGLRTLKDSLLQARPEPLVVPEAPVARADVSPPGVSTTFEGLANLPDNALAGFSVVPSDATLAVGQSHVF